MIGNEKCEFEKSKLLFGASALIDWALADRASLGSEEAFRKACKRWLESFEKFYPKVPKIRYSDKEFL